MKHFNQSFFSFGLIFWFIAQDGTVIPPETVVPAFSRYSGSPGKPVGELPECTQVRGLENIYFSYSSIGRRPRPRIWIFFTLAVSIIYFIPPIPILRFSFFFFLLFYCNNSFFLYWNFSPTFKNNPYMSLCSFLSFLFTQKIYFFISSMKCNFRIRWLTSPRVITNTLLQWGNKNSTKRLLSHFLYIAFILCIFMPFWMLYQDRKVNLNQRNFLHLCYICNRND